MKDLAVGTIVKDGSRYCLVFSNGRKECFSSRKKAEKREQQVKFFKNRDSKGSALEQYAMTRIGILAEYNPPGSDETLYIVNDQGTLAAFLTRRSAEGAEGAAVGELEVFKIEEGLDEYEKYSEILQATLHEAEAAFDNASQITLSEAVIENQLIAGSHTHSVSLDATGFGTTDEVDGHTHFVDAGGTVGYIYIASAPMNVAGITLSHTHLPVIQSKGG
jgi:hypothetical protein